MDRVRARRAQAGTQGSTPDPTNPPAIQRQMHRFAADGDWTSAESVLRRHAATCIKDLLHRLSAALDERLTARLRHRRLRRALFGR